MPRGHESAVPVGLFRVHRLRGWLLPELGWQDRVFALHGGLLFRDLATTIVHRLRSWFAQSTACFLLLTLDRFAGKFSNTTQLTNCFTCGPGKYAAKSGSQGATTCSPCDATSYIAVSGAGVCLKCPLGYAFV